MPNIRVTRPEFESYWVNRKRRLSRKSYDTAALDLFSRWETLSGVEPSDTRKRLVSNFIVELKDKGPWFKMDACYMLASGLDDPGYTTAHDATAALQNWVKNAYNLTAVNSPAFVVDRGYTGDGSTSYLETGFNPTTAVGAKFTQNSGAMGLWSRTNLANGGASSFDMGNTNSQIDRQGVVSGQAVGRSNTGAGIVIAPGAYPGDASWSRTASNVWEGYAQGVDAGGGTDASAALTNATFRLLSLNSGAFGVNQLSSADWGSGMSDAERLAIKTARQTFLQAIGAA